MAKKQPEFSYDKTLARIRQIAERMQSGEPDFEESMALFKEGTALITQCQTFLDESELVIKQVAEQNGVVEETDF
jgi:exodeoxyribonuclease VII small subunit